MTASEPIIIEQEPVFVCAPFGRDAWILDHVISAGTPSLVQVVNDFDQLADAQAETAGLFVITAEAAKSGFLNPLGDYLAAEPTWSLPPVVCLLDRTEDAGPIAEQLGLARPGLHITVLIRPCSKIEIVSAIGAAIEIRRQQYRIRDLFRQYEAAEKRADFLFEELSHRVKNMFAVATRLAVKTEKGSETSRQFSDDFSARMQALSNSYDTLREGNWKHAPLSTLIHNSVQSILVPTEFGRLRLSGPELQISSHQATSLGLVLHELGSNARKYGALSNAEGWVRIEWRTIDDGDRLELDWSEERGPPASLPEQEGFGLTVIKRSIPSADVKLDYAAEGLRCRLSFRLLN
ncbi:sensor histidine kinase [Erythrobacter sp.]|uniref:sensor histidine kinase n=1 Tax=Erythrobacter sp. TaxID=1042 RepID=UPI003C71E2B8